jgi:hypothetical protein
MYVGGSLSSIPEKTKGELDVSGETEARFNSRKGTFGFQFKKITSLEYGQKAGRRVGVALAVNPLFLFSKKRKHYLTIGFNDDEGKPQGVVLEVGKGNVRPLIAALTAKSGKEVEYESEDARKHAGN